MTGDGAALPRLAYIDEGCPGPAAAGGCETSGPRTCRPLLLDTALPVTTLPHRRPGDTKLELRMECLEVRQAGGLAAAAPSPGDLDHAVTRLRIHDLPLLRADAAETLAATWSAGDETLEVEVAGVLGGNVLRHLAVRLEDSLVPTVRFFDDYPGSEEDLAREGRAFLRVQFPGRLLGKGVPDRCTIDGEDCQLPGLDLTPDQDPLVLVPTRMVLDACVAPPPCAVAYTPGVAPAPGTCSLQPGPDAADTCASADAGGLSASLVVATSVRGLVLFSDSLERFFGAADTYPDCADVGAAAGAVCREGQDASLAIPGWPRAGVDAPLQRVRIRSLALVPGGDDSREPGPCTRVDRRLAAARQQCRRYTLAAAQTGDGIYGVSPPFSARSDAEDGPSHGDDPAATGLVVLGEAFLPSDTSAPDPTRWIEARILPADHPFTLSLRRDVAPEALQPDGLLGTALLDGTDTILDYRADPPGVRTRCLHPESGACLALPRCAKDGDAACCHGMPAKLLQEFLEVARDDVCCGALSAEAREAISATGELCQDFTPP
jgi:hypothetical protein